ncbi:hypothetical protein [Streptomyces lincolnensis]|uniref:hypothetical protein n=1 Tax=Streptomyces lincolnensis TaxID=1915 RepID=UPI001E3F6ACE|nr:hypothetical protein [Streptomyces lincolnensis]
MATVTVGAVQEREPGERRVALVTEAGIDVLVETGAGSGTWSTDADYSAAGAGVAGPRGLPGRTAPVEKETTS